MSAALRVNSDEPLATVDSFGGSMQTAPDRSRGAIGYLAMAAPAWVIVGDSAYALVRGWRIASRLEGAIVAAAAAPFIYILF